MTSHYKILRRRTIHPFPARMAASVALEAVAKVDGQRLTVVDPMSGSGTVLAVAKANGHRAIGFDSDPLAVLLSRVWTSALPRGALVAAGESVFQEARDLTAGLDMEAAYPTGADQETRDFVDYWFDPKARTQLTALARAIVQVENRPLREALWVAFSRLIIVKKNGASLAMDLAHSRPHRVFKTAKVYPFEAFHRAVSVVASNTLVSGATGNGPRARITPGDARELPLPENVADLVVTSPPYLNAIDYIRCSKYSLVWMGHTLESLRELRGGLVGTEVGLPDSQWSAIVDRTLPQMGRVDRLADRYLRIVARYVRDMAGVLSEYHRILRPTGSAVVVVGDSTVRGQLISNSAAVASVAEEIGFAIEKRQTRQLPPNSRYMPPPKAGKQKSDLDKRMRSETVLHLRVA